MEISMTTVRVCTRCCLPYISTHSSSILFLFAITTFSASAAPSTSPLHPSHEWVHSGADSTKLYTGKRTLIVRAVAAACAAVSMTASFICFYWFFRMEKRFRHRLIMILVFGDAMKASWLFIFAVTAIARCTVPTKSLFCQTSGFLIQYGTETSDYAVLVMAIHSAVQVFRPSATASNDGLYPYRACVYAGGLLIPGSMAGLAFINPHWGYMSQGAFCTLPLRPLWYRLALAWIPRYVIAIVIVTLAIAIYAHVGWEFRSFSNVSESARPSMSTTTPRNSAGEMEEGPMGEASSTYQPDPQYALPQGRTSSVARSSIADPQYALPQGRTSSVARSSIAASQYALPQGRTSSVARSSIAASRQASQVAHMVEATVSVPESIHRVSQLPFAPHNTHRSSVHSQPPFAPHNTYRSSVHIPTGARNSGVSLAPIHTRPSVVKSKEYLGLHPESATFATNSGDASPLSECPNTAVHRHMVQERARIHKQLRLIFIYPLVYILMWMIPFVSHCMNYSDKWAANPLYGLSVTSTICITLMGFVDSLIFSLRERPWRHMPTSDGSFFGSFVVFRRMSASSQGGLRRPTDSLQRLHTETNPETPNMAGVSRGLGSNVFSSSFPNLLAGRSNRVRRRSDQKTAAEMARVRLEFEKQDRRQTLEKDRERGSVPGSITVLQTIDSPQEEESERESHNERESHDEKESQDEKKSAAMEQSWPSSS